MSCRSFEDLARELSGDGEGSLDAATRAAALAHAVECEPCASRLDEERRLGRALQGMAAAGADVEAPPYVEAALLGAFRAHATAASRARRISRRESWTWGLAAAAVIGLGVGLVAWWPRATTGGHTAAASVPAAEPRVETRENDPPKAAEAASSLEPAPRVSAPRPRAPRVAKARPAASAVLARAEATRRRRAESDREQYVPWLWADPTTEFDRGHVVRVGLPRSALASWGWPLEGDVADEPVEAELLLGEDGVARAIRVVR